MHPCQEAGPTRGWASENGASSAQEASPGPGHRVSLLNGAEQGETSPLASRGCLGQCWIRWGLRSADLGEREASDTCRN